MPDAVAKILTRENFGAVLTPIHKKIFFDSYKEKPCQYSQVFKKDTMRGKQQTYPHLGSLGAWQPGQEGKVFNLSDFKEGATATFIAQRYDNSYKITWELIQDDYYNVMKGYGKGGSAKGLGRGARVTEERQAANIVLNGFTTAGYDGKPLFAEDHPLINSTKTGCNLIHGALTDANLKKALTMLRKQPDEAGEIIDTHATQLVVAPENEFTAKAIVNSILQSGTNNNDVNTVPNLKVVVWDYLSNDTTNPWFVQDESIDNLMFLDREAAMFGSQFIPGQMDSLMYGYERFAAGYVDWRGIVGSDGIN